MKRKKTVSQDYCAITINNEKKEIWVWTGPNVSKTEITQGNIKLKQWKVKEPAYQFHNCPITAKDWSKPEKISQKLGISTDLAKKFKSAYKSHKISSYSHNIGNKTIQVIGIL